MLPSSSVVLDSVSLTQLGPLTLREHQTFTFKEDCSYLAYLTDDALEEELSTLAYYTRQAYAISAIGGVGRMDVCLDDRHHKERQLLQDNITDLTLQCDMYLKEVKKDFISITKMDDAFSFINLPDSLVE